jgi:probable F420-dependent oxidoreductase
MRVGVDLPFLSSPSEIRDYVQAVEELGFDHLGFSEHIAATTDTLFPGPSFSFDEPWRESFTLASFIAAVTNRIELNPAMVLLPLYHPVLAAKLAAEADNLSGGRLRIAAGVGWNRRECESLGVDPATRGHRFEEQVVVMRRLWTERSVDFDGTYFQLSGAGISLRPQRPIPLWLGGGRVEHDGGFPPRRSIERAGRLADGFKFVAPTFFDQDRVARVINDLRTVAADVGRDPSAFGIEVRVIAQATTPAEWPAHVARAKAMGATHLGFSNRIAGGTVATQLALLREFAESTRHLW